MKQDKSMIVYCIPRMGIILVVLACLPSLLRAKHFSPNVLSVLDQPFITKKDGSKDIEPNVSYLFADLKFDGQSLKICEFGPCPYAGRPISKLIIHGKTETMKSPYWGLFWHCLHKLDVPVWCVGGRKKIEMDQLTRIQGHYAKKFTSIPKIQRCNACLQKGGTSKLSIADYSGIVVFACGCKPQKVKSLKKRYPAFLFVNDRTGKFASHKNLMNPLFAQCNLTDYKPRCGLYPKKYSPELILQIQQDLKADFFIIKPINSLQSRGVIMVPFHELDQTLRLILNDSESLKKVNHRSLRYWAGDKNTSFIVEQYVPSKTIQVNQKSYDPTMRLVFCLWYDQGVITTHVLGGFWKIPVKSLHDDCSLTEQHVTIPFSGHDNVGIPVSEQDMQVAKGLLAEMLTTLYGHILDMTC